MLQEEIEDASLLEEWLSVNEEGKSISACRKRHEGKLVELAANNATLVLSKDRETV